MRKSYTFCMLCCLLSFFAQGKVTGISVPNLFPHFGSGLNSPVASNSRIIGQTFLKFSGGSFLPFDSITYSYSFGRGGSLSDEMDDHYVNFDNSITYLYEQTNGVYRYQFHRSQNYSQNNNPISYTSKSWNLSNNSWRDSSRFVYNYNSQETRLESTMFQIWQNAWFDHVNFQNVFDGAGNLVKMNSTVFAMEFVYDASNRLITRTEKKFSFSIGWYYSNRYNFSYDNNSNMTFYTVEKHDGSSWGNVEKFDMSYTPTSPGFELTATTEYAWVNNNWSITGRHLFGYNSSHNKISDEYQYWDGNANSFQKAILLQWTYNNFSQPLSYFSRTWDVSANAWIATTDDFLYRYYYQTYSPTSVAPVGSEKVDIVLFPQPAQNSLSVLVSSGDSRQYDVQILDMQGKLLKQTQSKEQQLSISVNDLPSGNYVLRLNSKEHQYNRQFAVSH